jgi:hypothetical protein
MGSPPPDPLPTREGELAGNSVADAILFGPIGVLSSRVGRGWGWA